MIFNKTDNKKSLVRQEFSFPALGCYIIPLIYFIGTVAYQLIRYGKTYTTGYYLIHYLYTYKHGFVARGFTGEVISWFFETVSDEQLANISIFINICLALSVSLYVGRMLQLVRKDKYRFSLLFLLVLVFFVFADPVKYYAIDVKLDKILWTLTFVAVILTQSRFGIWAVPAICVIATLVNPVFLFCSMILISIILLQEFHSKNYSLKNGIICGVSYASMIALGLFGVQLGKLVNFSTPAELIDFYFSRYTGTLDAETYRLFETEWLFDYFEPIGTVLRKSYEIYFWEWGNNMRTALHFTLIALPAYILTTLFWKRTIKYEENKFQKFIFFLCAISPLVIIPPVVLSWEFSKYFYNNILIQVCLIIYYIINKSPSLLHTIKDIELYCKSHLFQSFAVSLYFVTYIAVFSI